MAILDTNEIMFTAFEPKLQNRFIMYIDGIPAYLIKKVARPSITFGEVTLDHINVKRKIKGPVGDIVEEWILKGAYVQSANFGDMDWSSDSPANISLTIVMDYAILNY